MYHIELYYSNFHFSLTFFSFFIKNIVGINAPNEVEAHLPAGDPNGFDDVDIQPEKIIQSVLIKLSKEILELANLPKVQGVFDLHKSTKVQYIIPKIFLYINFIFCICYHTCSNSFLMEICFVYWILIHIYLYYDATNIIFVDTSNMIL